MIRRPPRSTQSRSSAASDVYKRQIQTDVCSICRGQLMEPCIPFLTLGIECQANPGANEECTVAWGACNHSFHWHCISRWIKTRNTCPLDNNNWELQRLGK
eukprot:TRINITY_DN12812_c0_g1_i14.p2 TRINITY_DN12812_c0_g1~~TRINITY_DN12812_c0_g1_i14.p2  ORF type:complete len:111 (+),score=29.12 TRINITY_DN12812_c0_g1_i14:32-334(+)